MQDFFNFLELNEPIIAQFLIILLFVYTFFYYKYLKEADETISYFKAIFERDKNALSKEVWEQKNNFWKKKDDKSINKKLAKFFLILPITLLLIAALGIIASRIIFLNSL